MNGADGENKQRDPVTASIKADFATPLHSCITSQPARPLFANVHGRNDIFFGCVVAITCVSARSRITARAGERAARARHDRTIHHRARSGWLCRSAEC
jgi:hypothetical protein